MTARVMPKCYKDQYKPIKNAFALNIYGLCRLAVLVLGKQKKAFLATGAAEPDLNWQYSLRSFWGFFVLKGLICFAE
jgi:hypothetical protein